VVVDVDVDVDLDGDGDGDGDRSQPEAIMTASWRALLWSVLQSSMRFT
jgi:hypothetical protein